MDECRTFAVYPDGTRHEIAYSVRLLCPLFVEDGAPGEIQYQAGEVIVMPAHEAVDALADGYGELVGEIIDGVRRQPLPLPPPGVRLDFDPEPIDLEGK